MAKVTIVIEDLPPQEGKPSIGIRVASEPKMRLLPNGNPDLGMMTLAQSVGQSFRQGIANAMQSNGVRIMGKEPC